VVGDLKRSDVEKLISRHLGDWKNGPEAPPAPTPPPAPGSAETKLIDRELTQANIILGHLGIPRNHPDFYTVTVMNYILGGGGFSSRLMTEIRDNRGLAYSVHSAFRPMKAGGSFSIGLQTKNASANQAIAEIRKLLATFQADGATAQELEEAKAYLIGSFPLRLDTNAKLVGLLASIEFFELGLDYFDDYPRKIAKVTLADVKRAAARHLQPDRLTLVVVAKQADARIEASTPSPAGGGS
jgi:zinc protease